MTSGNEDSSDYTLSGVHTYSTLRSLAFNAFIGIRHDVRWGLKETNRCISGSPKHGNSE